MTSKFSQNNINTFIVIGKCNPEFGKVMIGNENKLIVIYQDFRLYHTFLRTDPVKQNQ